MRRVAFALALAACAPAARAPSNGPMVREPGVAHVEGEVRDPGGAPLAGTTIVVVLPDGARLTTITDDQGRWTADVPAGGALRITAYYGEQTIETQATVPAGTTQETLEPIVVP